jgi:hypothetical protein
MNTRPKLMAFLVHMACARIGAEWRVKNQQLTAS